MQILHILWSITYSAIIIYRYNLNLYFIFLFIKTILVFNILSSRGHVKSYNKLFTLQIPFQKNKNKNNIRINFILFITNTRYLYCQTVRKRKVSLI